MPDHPVPRTSVYLSTLALVPALGYGVVGTCSFALTLLGVLRPATVFPVVGIVTGVLWFVGLRRGSLRARATAVSVVQATAGV